MTVFLAATAWIPRSLKKSTKFRNQDSEALYRNFLAVRDFLSAADQSLLYFVYLYSTAS
jgi:hypothetical protein